MGRSNLVVRLVKGRGWRIRRFLSDRVPDRVVLARRFERAFGRRLNLKNPRTFNEKLFWLMLHYRTPLVTRLADKYEVRSYVAERIGSGVLNELYGVWDHVGDIDFENLPEAFALKVTWGTARNIFCRNKSELNVHETKERLAYWMSRNYYWVCREWCYKHIKPRIICERFVIDSVWGTPPDYKFFCFGGEPRFVQVDTDRFTQHKRDLFDLDWQAVPFTYQEFPSSKRAIPRPSNWEEMVAFARILSRGFPFVRTDLYSLNGRTLFGEMTWYPSAGEGRFWPDSYDWYWGEALQLPPRPIYRRWWTSLRGGTALPKGSS